MCAARFAPLLPSNELRRFPFDLHWLVHALLGPGSDAPASRTWLWQYWGILHQLRILDRESVGGGQGRLTRSVS